MAHRESFIDIKQMSDAEKRLLFGEPPKSEISLIKTKNPLASVSNLNDPTKNFQIDDQFPDIAAKLAEKKKNKCSIQRLVIGANNPIKSFWDIFILFLIGYSCITSAYYVAFETPTSTALINFENFVEVAFIVDIVLRFFHAFKDLESYEYVSDLRKIAKNYITGWFFIDFVAIIPLNWFISSNTTWIKLVRLLRLPKFLRIVDQNRFEQLLSSIFENTNRQKRMNYLYASKYIYKVIRLIIIATTLTYFMGCLWYFVASNKAINPGPVTFNSYYNLDQYPQARRLVMCCYFALTTLATVGYGDLTPQSNIEKVFGILIMILGIALFSYIMGNFNDVLTNYDKRMGIVDKGADLQVWMTSLSKFTSNQPLPRDLVQKIDEHFKFFWKNDRLSSLTLDDKYLNLMPKQLRYNLICYLFDDIFQMFRGFLLKKEFPESQFYYEIAFEFLPRKYDPEEIIIKKGDVVHEIYMIMEGSVHIYFEWEGKKIGRNFGLGYFFGNYNIFTDNVSEFTFKAIRTTGNVQTTKIFAIPKQKILKILKNYPDIFSKMVANSRKNIKSLREILMHELKLQMQKTKGQFPSQDELQKGFKECVTDQVKPPNAALLGTFKHATAITKGLGLGLNQDQKAENGAAGDNAGNFSKTVGEELDEITSRLEKLRDHLTTKDKFK